MAIRYPAEFTAGQATDYLSIRTCRRNYGSNGGQAWNKFDEVILNVPQKVVESIGQSWRNSTLGPEVGAIMTGQLSPGGNLLGLTGRVIQRMVENALMDQTTQAMGKLGASNLSENSILSGTSGIIYNPNMEVLYDGPQFRQFNFQFVLFAKSGDDAKNIHKIVRFFQKASVPTGEGATVNSSLVSGVIGSSTAVNAASSVAQALPDIIKGNASGAIGTLVTGVAGGIGTSIGAGFTGTALFTGDTRFITQPPFVQLTFKRGSDQHPYILPTKPCAINNLSIDYTPSGNYTILNNFGESEVATVVVTTISMSLTEVKTVFSEDYDNVSQFSGVD